jgi:hypothetical protein
MGYFFDQITCPVPENFVIITRESDPFGALSAITKLLSAVLVALKILVWGQNQ